MPLSYVSGGQTVLASITNAIIDLIQNLTTGHTHNESDSRKLATLDTTSGHNHDGSNSKTVVNISGSSASCTGNAATVSTLQGAFTASSNIIGTSTTNSTRTAISDGFLTIVCDVSSPDGYIAVDITVAGSVLSAGCSAQWNGGGNTCYTRFGSVTVPISSGQTWTINVDLVGGNGFYYAIWTPLK